MAIKRGTHIWSNFKDTRPTDSAFLHTPKNGIGNKNACCSYRLKTPSQLVYWVKNTIST
jgi:hypothetical protein